MPIDAALADSRGHSNWLDRDSADFDKSPEWCQLEGRQPPAHYHAVAARARRLQTEATTPRLKQYLQEMIAQSERLAGAVEIRAKPTVRSRSRFGR
jgi:hypothetical protein